VCILIGLEAEYAARNLEPPHGDQLPRIGLGAVAGFVVRFRFASWLNQRQSEASS
jgi:hypothetical protein